MMFESLLQFLLYNGGLLRSGGRCEHEDGVISTRARTDRVDDSVEVSQFVQKWLEFWWFDRDAGD